MISDILCCKSSMICLYCRNLRYHEDLANSMTGRENPSVAQVAECAFHPRMLSHLLTLDDHALYLLSEWVTRLSLR